VERKVLDLLGYQQGVELGVWAEVKLKYTEQKKGVRKKFDYTFDYILMPIGRASQSEIENITGKTWRRLQPALESKGYTIARRDGEYFVEDFPAGAPSIVEIMTSSTSGGNKKLRTTIPMSFEDAVTGKSHNAPGINYRQVWARMVSQLIVKSEVGLHWDGKTIWLAQDVLVDYICASTALDIRSFFAAIPSEVNMLSLSYGGAHAVCRSGALELSVDGFFAGPIGVESTTPSFQDMIRAPILPDLSTTVLQDEICQ
jgi:hypothetical protein